MHVSHRRILAALLATVLGAFECHALGTGFTYQGQLLDGGGAPVGEATCDLKFSLFADAVAPGGQVGATQTLTGVPVTNGTFTVTLNAAGEFSATAFSGPDRFLEIQVRCPAGSGSYALLTPRQPLTAGPYALYAANAGDVAFDYAGSTSKGGPASDLACSGCVAATDLAANAVGATQLQNGTVGLAKLSAAGSAAGQVVASNGAAAVWQDAPTSLPPSGAAGGGLSGSYPNPALAANAVGSAQIQSGAVTLPKLSVTGSAAGQVLASTGSAAQWQADGLTLPFSKTLSNGATGIEVQNAGGQGVSGRSDRADAFGVGVSGYASAASGFTRGVYGQSDSPAGNGVGGYSAGGIGVAGATLSGFAMSAGGDTTQSRDRGGWLKAAVIGTSTPAFLRCFNSQDNPARTSGTCGFTITKNGVGDYTVDFGFQVDDRFYSLAVQHTSSVTGTVFTLAGQPNKLGVHTFSNGSPSDVPNFHLLIY